MRTDNHKLLKDFTEMCKEITVNKNGEVFCMFDNLEHDDDYKHIVSSDDYTILKEKMNKLVDIVNKDITLLNKDLEEDLWQLL